MTARFLHGLEEFEPRNGSVVTVGTFDGIHRGHQAIFADVRETARQMKLNPVLVTFHPHPRVVVTPSNVPMLLTSLEEKKRFVPDFFDGQVVILEFNEALKNMSAEEFVRDVLVARIHTKQLIVGYDHALGRNREGTVEQLKAFGEQYGFGLDVVGPVVIHDKPVSSSRIRDLLEEGNLTLALELLGHEYAICGTVERGIGLGRKIGYPTANIRYSHRKLLPREGVYACWVEVDGASYPGMMFIGHNQFNPEDKVSVEANIFDFDRDIYNEDIVVYPTCYVRESRHFATTDELVAQLAEDKKAVLNVIEKGEKACK
ncbi:MAG: bifunctional riboflavin kinase/FAD synthetase [Candidatus Zixiibacteriota bacterium]|nr:MAG: bifunctional riboflavin kinase/FAD synthetase [candidate division Zixibacteria bacterium]